MCIEKVAKMIDLNQFDAARLFRASKATGMSPEKTVRALVRSFLSRLGCDNLAGAQSRIKRVRGA